MRVLVLSGVAVFAVFQPIAAQGVAEASLACFENADRCDPRPIHVSAILLEPQKFGLAAVSTVLDGLERIAVHSEDPALQRSAALWLAAAGWKGYRPTPIAGVVSRLVRVYRASTAHRIRAIIVSQMIPQVEDVEAASFLELVAQEDDPRERGYEWSTAYLAVNALSHMGPRGLAVLKRLHQQGSVSPTAKGYLEYLKERDFKPE